AGRPGQPGLLRCDQREGRSHVQAVAVEVTRRDSLRGERRALRGVFFRVLNRRLARWERPARSAADMRTSQARSMRVARNRGQASGAAMRAIAGRTSPAAFRSGLTRWKKTTSKPPGPRTAVYPAALRAHSQGWMPRPPRRWSVTATDAAHAPRCNAFELPRLIAARPRRRVAPW